MAFGLETLERGSKYIYVSVNLRICDHTKKKRVNLVTPTSVIVDLPYAEQKIEMPCQTGRTAFG